MWNYMLTVGKKKLPDNRNRSPTGISITVFSIVKQFNGFGRLTKYIAF